MYEQIWPFSWISTIFKNVPLSKLFTSYSRSFQLEFCKISIFVQLFPCISYSLLLSKLYKKRQIQYNI